MRSVWSGTVDQPWLIMCDWSGTVHQLRFIRYSLSGTVYQVRYIRYSLSGTVNQVLFTMYGWAGTADRVLMIFYTPDLVRMIWKGMNRCGCRSRYTVPLTTGFPDNSRRKTRRGQFGADNSARHFVPDNSAQNIYIINFIQNPTSTQQYSFHQSRFHFSNFSSISLPFRQHFSPILIPNS